VKSEAGYVRSCPRQADQGKNAASDQVTLRQIKNIDDDLGFPTRAMVGIDGASTAFLLASTPVKIQNSGSETCNLPRR